MKNLNSRLAVVMVLLTAMVLPAQAREVGKTLFARGAVTAQQGANVRIIGNGAPVFEGDVFTSGPRSYAVIRYTDGTRMTLRPSSQLKVATFKTEAGEESALLRLFKGGFRAITGLIARANPDGFNVQTTVATIGIRGTDFSARLCDEECVAEQSKAATRKQKPAAAKGPEVVGRVAFVKGSMGARSDGTERRMLVGAAVYAGDTLETAADSFAVVAFRDETRVTLQERSVFVVERLAYDATDGEKSGALMRLLRGGVRVITGLISKVRPGAFEVETPVATLSARGTRFTVVCLDACAETSAEAGWPARLLDLVIPRAQAQIPAGGLLIAMQDGALVATFLATGQTTTFTSGQIGLLRMDGGVQLLATLPAGLPLQGPDPADTPFDARQFQAEPLPPDTEGALIVAVYDEGHAEVRLADGTRLSIGQNEAVFADGSRVVNVAGGTPEFIRSDRYNFSPDLVDTNTTPGGAPVDPAEQKFECTL